MRPLNPVTNLVIAAFAGVALLASLTLPWFKLPAESPNPTDGPIERAAYHVEQVFAANAKGMVDGTDAVGGGQLALLVLVGIVAVLAGLIAGNVARHHTEDAMRVVALASPLVVLVVGLTHSGINHDVQIHYGFLVALAASLLMANAAWHGASLRAKAAAPARPRYSR